MFHDALQSVLLPNISFQCAWSSNELQRLDYRTVVPTKVACSIDRGSAFSLVLFLFLYSTINQLVGWHSKLISLLQHSIIKRWKKKKTHMSTMPLFAGILCFFIDYFSHHNSLLLKSLGPHTACWAKASTVKSHAVLISLANRFPRFCESMCGICIVLCLFPAWETEDQPWLPITAAKDIQQGDCTTTSAAQLHSMWCSGRQGVFIGIVR